MTFGSLEIAYDGSVLRPRPWTALQSLWAAELLAEAPAGPVLELCAGVGQIGLLAIASLQPPAMSSGPSARRRLVCVDSSADACRQLRRNAEAAGVADVVEVRETDLAEAVRAEERFALVIADPPWVPSDEVGRFPEDPPGAIDGGPDGLDAARACLRVAAPHLQPGGAVLLQLGSREQADAIGREIIGLDVREVRDGAGGVVVLLRRSTD